MHVYIHPYKLYAYVCFRKGFELAFDLLEGASRTGCQSIIVLITDGKDTDGESVRCGPGDIT